MDTDTPVTPAVAMEVTLTLSEYDALKSEIENLKGTNQYHLKTLSRLYSQRDSLETYLKDNRDNLEEHTQEIASIFGLILSYDYVVEVLIKARFSITTSDEIDEDWVSDNLSVISLDGKVSDSEEVIECSHEVSE
jgi:hypothetical protein